MEAKTPAYRAMPSAALCLLGLDMDDYRSPLPLQSEHAQLQLGSGAGGFQVITKPFSQ